MKNGVWRKILLPSVKHTDKQLNKMTKKGLIRLVIKLEKFIVKVVYQMYKSKLPRLKTIKRKALPKRKTKRKFSPKQLAAQRLFTKRAKAGTLRRKRFKKRYGRMMS